MDLELGKEVFIISNLIRYSIGLLVQLKPSPTVNGGLQVQVKFPFSNPSL